MPVSHKTQLEVVEQFYCTGIDQLVLVCRTISDDLQEDYCIGVVNTSRVTKERKQAKAWAVNFAAGMYDAVYQMKVQGHG